ncbi:MAG: glycosyltransferase family 4 protein [Proteobacteria bacterium]|nr:glycosyltransferase family 4 protein [Pseudomonadota bacterium]MBU4258232.1 glycosyltransferase family 4 protein [Pseudomonadota bacterium]MBU4289062.1 glycosyltransferase family 4 protein [Pseudomonadota bacterium]MBU4413730.1 glycosyltransferase family 4 protein [Pseudomonadota bacterium]MCG2758121.1 glycosyltransferase family 4 protein [Desulfobacteraceae bacterium]
MKICFIIEYYSPHIGGGEVLFQNLAVGLVKAGHQCDVVTCLLPGTEEHEKVNGVDIYRVPVPQFADRYWFTILSIPLAWQIAKKADVIHTMTYNGAFPAWLIARLQKKPVVMLAHEVLGKKWFNLNFNFFISFLCKLLEDLVLCLPYDAYSCNSKSTMNSLKNRGIDPQKLFLAYPGIDYELFVQKAEDQEKKIRKQLGVRNSTFIYMYYGRPGMVKGIEYLVKAVPLIKKEIPDSKLILILSKRPATKYAEILRLIKELNLEDVIVLDPVPRKLLPYYIQASDCVVVPSINEGFGFTCVEACAMGKPVVATNVGSLPEVISGKYVLVSPGNAEQLAEGVMNICSGRYDISEKKVFRWENTVQKHIEVYKKIAIPK